MSVVTAENARQAITTKVEALRATWVDYPLVVEYSNGKSVNLSEQKDPYLSVTIVYSDGYQVGLGPTSDYRSLGTLVLEACDKEGFGTARMNKLLDHFYRSMHKTDSMFPVRTYAARFVSVPPKLGWAKQAAAIPFWYDSE